MTTMFEYHELHSPNPEQAFAFYGELLGWKFEKTPAPMPYWSMKDAAAGAMKDERPHWLPYVTVKSASASLEKAKALGGTVLQPLTEVKGQGTFAVVADPQGAPFALWQRTEG